MSIVFAEMHRSLHNITKQNLKKISEGLDVCRKKLKDRYFQIVVFADVKAGKSTFLNSLLGQDFLPVTGLPETAQVTRIRHNSKYPNGVLRHKNKIVKGVSNIRNYIAKINARARCYDAIATQGELVVDAPLCFLSQEVMSEERFEILDTPGVNEAGFSSLNSAISELMTQADVVVYLLDSTNLYYEQALCILENLKTKRESIVSSYSDRFFIVVNKIDQSQTYQSSSLTPEEIKESVAGIINKQIEGIHIGSDQVFPVSALWALLSRVVQRKNASKEEIQDFLKVTFGINYDEEKVTEEEILRAADILLKESRIQLIENAILLYIYTHSKQLLFEGIIDRIEREIEILMVHVDTALEAFNSDNKFIRIYKEQLQQDCKILDELKK